MMMHRCMGSLKAGVSILYEKGWVDSQNAWWMWKPVTHDNWSTKVLTPIAEIRFCPFCGQNLEVPKEKTSDE